MSAISIPNLWVPRRKKLWLPTPTWAMGNLFKASHHLVKYSHHLTKVDCGDRFIQAKKCDDNSDVGFWFRLLPGDDTTVTFTTPTGAHVHLSFFFKVDGVCYYVDHTCNISTSPGTVITDRDSLEYHGSCDCEPDNPIYYPVYECCTGDFVGYILVSAFATWQSDNSTSATVGTDGSTCWRVDNTVWFFNAPDPHVGFGGRTPVDGGCASSSCCCCKPLECCDDICTTSCTGSFSYTTVDPLSESGSFSLMPCNAHGYTYYADDGTTFMGVNIDCSDGPRVALVVTGNNVDATSATLTHVIPVSDFTGTITGGFDFIVGPGGVGGSGTWSVTIDLSTC